MAPDVNWVQGVEEGGEVEGKERKAEYRRCLMIKRKMSKSWRKRKEKIKKKVLFQLDDVNRRGGGRHGLMGGELVSR